MRTFTPIFTLSLSATLLMVGVGMIVALLPQRVHAMIGTLESVGLIASVFALAYLLAQIPIGILSDRLGAKRLLIFGYVLCGISGLVFLSAESAGSIYLGRAVQGLGEAPVWALGPAVLSLAYPHSKGRAIGIYNAAIHAGLTLGPLLGLLIAPTGEGGLPFLVFSALCFCASALVLLFLRDTHVKTESSRTSVQQLLLVLSRTRLVIILSGILFYGASYGVFVSVLPISLSSLKTFSAQAVSIHFALFYAAISLSQIVAGSMSDRIGRQGFMIWGMIAAAIGIGAFPFIPGVWVYVPLCIASLGLGVFCVTSIAELNDCVSDDLKGAISGSYYFFWGTGYVLGPILIGTLASCAPLIGYSALVLSLAFFSLLIWLVRK